MGLVWVMEMLGNIWESRGAFLKIVKTGHGGKNVDRRSF